MTRKNECTGSLIETLGKVIPERDSGKIKERCGNPIGADLGNVSKHNDVDKHRQDRLEDEPNRSQDRLFVNGDNVTLYEHIKQIAVVPELL